MFSVMLMDACHDERPGIRIAYRMDGWLLNQRLMHSHSRVSTATIQELLFAGGCALIAMTEGDIQMRMELFAVTCDNFGLRINAQKSVIIHQPPPNTIFNAARINFDGAQLKFVDTFTYLDRNLPAAPKSTTIRPSISTSDHLVSIDDERLPKRLFYGDVAAGSRRKVGQVRRYKDNPITTPKKMQINPANLEDLARNRPAWRRTDSWITALKAKFWQESPQRLGSTPQMPNPSQHAHAVNAPSSRESALSTTFGRNAPTIQQLQLLRPLLPTLLPTPSPPMVTPGTNSTNFCHHSDNIQY
ncbi:unnamed protein product [Schistocephalus solidus]|uniref:Reverse transcriptase domain-containing protein n=1 Tax=Schistocephalus solidus TaxID=70667 RepID=A0A183SPY4_SCHSO|nr:unnamed protein product [Schistocephalus solidus]